MQHSLTIVEKYSRYWPVAAIFSGILSIVVYLLSLDVDVLTAGILRLAAFGLFSLSVFSFLKWRDGQMIIEIKEVDDNSVILNYSRRNRQILEESIDLSDIRDVRFSTRPDRTLFSSITWGGVSLQVKSGKSKDWIYLFSVYDRVLLLDKEDADSAISYFKHCIRK